MQDNKITTNQPESEDFVIKFIQHLIQNPAIIDELSRILQEEKSEIWE